VKRIPAIDDSGATQQSRRAIPAAEIVSCKAA
jgi:hypothetical protein